MVLFKARVLGALLACCAGCGCASRAATPPTLPAIDRGHKSYVLPAVEIAAMDVAVNLGGRLLVDREKFTVTPASIRRNLRSRWVVDRDPFQLNQLGHPYQGAMYHGIARSNGLGYWTSTGYTFAASALWEIAGETTTPSRNDQIASGIAGSFLGESLFRISRLFLQRPGGSGGGWRALAAVLASPPAGINQVLVGHPAGSLEAAVPFSDVRVELGVAALRTGRSQTGWSSARAEPRLAVAIDYGYPGNGDRHDRPFDYFRLESRVSTDGVDHLSTRGLIAGTDYAAARGGGVLGLYGSYDYFPADGLRLSSTALSFGTTLQAPLSGALVAQSSALVGGGYVGAHSIHDGNGRDYDYRLAPQGLLSLRLIAGRRAALDLTAREYFVPTTGSGDRDAVTVADAALAVRLFRRHGVSVTYQFAGRRSGRLEPSDRADTRTTLGVHYTFLGSGSFGVAR